MPDIRGLMETALYVTDPDRSAAFYRSLFGFRTLLRSDRLHALQVGEEQVLLLFRRGGSVRPSETPGGTLPAHDGQGHLHMAFRVDEGELSAWEAALTDAGVPVESRVTGPRGGHSVYFRDPDGHLIELATVGLWPFDNPSP